MSEIRDMNGSHNDILTTPDEVGTKLAKNIYVPDYIDTIFQRIEAQDIEHFYKSYHFWSLQQRVKTLHTEIAVVQQAITDNGVLMQQMQPSVIALASLAQLQASGVNDLDLLDRMLERGETWLDHTMQLLEHCEELDVIGGDYTQWCEHALEGAYDWIESINATNTINIQEDEVEAPVALLTVSDEQQANVQEVTEEQLLQKLMSDEEITEKIPVHHPFSETEQPQSSARKITQPLQQAEQEVPEATLLTRKITQPLQQPEQEVTEPSLPTRKITQPLVQMEVSTETEIPETPPTDEIASDILTTREDTIERPEEQYGEDDPTQTEKMPALIIEQISETIGIGSEEKESVAAPEEEAEESITQKIVVSPTETVTASKDTDVQEVEDVTEEAVVSEENADQTRAESDGSMESLQESRKPQIPKMWLRGFWHLLGRLIAFILRR